MMATKTEMIDTVKLLLDRGADISSRDKVNYLIQSTLKPRIRCKMKIMFRHIADVYNIVDECSSRI